jgi:FkbM family methyltransferase
MRLIEQILSRDEFRECPPILVDVGASGGIHPKWRQIAKYSVCVGFEPDERERASLEEASRGFKALHTFNRAAAERAEERSPFYLTTSPFCSSRLAPDLASVGRYAFAPLFKVEQIVEMPTIDVPTALKQLGYDHVDWFKCDSQGTDLRVLRSLGDELISRVLVVELEPGIIDAYEGEDKLSDVMRFMASKSFWMSELSIEGSQRIDASITAARLTELERRYLRVSVKPAPGWGEVEYFNDFREPDTIGMRGFLLGYVFATVRGHHAFALELAVRGQKLFGNGVFSSLERAALRRIRARLARVPYSVAKELLARRRGT